jgi:VWFA-related protein
MPRETAAVRSFFFAIPCVPLFVPLLLAQGPRSSPAVQYKIDLNNDHVTRSFTERNGKKALWVTAQFKVLCVSDGTLANDVAKDEIVVEEDGQRVDSLEIHAPRSQKLTTVLAIDISGSMAGHGKMEEAKKAARAFLDHLDAKADTGLILFDHELRGVEPPVRDPARIAEHRAKLRRLIDGAQPGGGTAYLDATIKAVQMLKGIVGRRAVLLMTDGVDMNSRRRLPDVILEAQTAEVPVYTLGIGEPGKNEPVTTVLVLDKSGSMREPANDTDKKSKIDALREAAGRFVDLMRPGAKTTLLPFSDKIEKPQPFSDDKGSLKRAVSRLKPLGGTWLYDATLDGLETLMAARPDGKKAVVVLTDGKDEGSRRRPEEVIARAKEVQIPLHMLGLGRAHELNEPVMRQMAEQTGGSYHHATNQQSLFEIFEKLSIDLHDDGIDEKSLRTLAEETGGKYHPARDVSKLHLIYQDLAEELQSTYTVTFPSRRPSHDGTARGIDIKVMRGGQLVSDVGRADYNVQGIVVPEVDARVYLVLLALLGGLLFIPSGLRSLARKTK